MVGTQRTLCTAETLVELIGRCLLGNRGQLALAGIFVFLVVLGSEEVDEVDLDILLLVLLELEEVSLLGLYARELGHHGLTQGQDRRAVEVHELLVHGVSR